MRSIGAALLVAVLTGCGSSGSQARRDNPTFIEVSPDEFLGDVPCSTGSGGLRVYVATLLDLTHREESRGFALPSSPPTSCRASVFFRNVVPPSTVLGVFEEGHEYIAEIAGYDQDGLTQKHPGSFILQRDGTTVLPRWRGMCGARFVDSTPETTDAGPDAGDPDAGSLDAGVPMSDLFPVTPVFGRTVRMTNCFFDEVTEGPNTATISIDIRNALGSLQCGNARGEIAAFDVKFDGRQESARCGEMVRFSGLEPNGLLEFLVTAREGTDVPLDAGTDSTRDAGTNDAGMDPAEEARIFRTRCYQEPLPGIELAARCDPLRLDR